MFKYYQNICVLDTFKTAFTTLLFTLLQNLFKVKQNVKARFIEKYYYYA